MLLASSFSTEMIASTAPSSTLLPRLRDWSARGLWWTTPTKQPKAFAIVSQLSTKTLIAAASLSLWPVMGGREGVDDDGHHPHAFRDGGADQLDQNLDIARHRAKVGHDVGHEERHIRVGFMVLRVSRSCAA